MSSNRYERITTVDHAGQRVTRTLRIDGEGRGWVFGWRTTKHGEATAREIIDSESITKRVPLVMNRHYAELEEA